MTTYYDRTDPSKNYDALEFVAGRGLQSAELNEIQTYSRNRLRGIADALFKDGDIVSGARVVINGSTATCESGAIYIAGAVRGVPPATLTIATTGQLSIGIRLASSFVTSADDPLLLDPATGTRNYNQPGADRLKLEPSWAVGDPTNVADFYPVYSVTDGVLDAKEVPPNLDAITRAIAGYDRDSSGGMYVVNGLAVSALADPDSTHQAYSIAEGRARVLGFAVEFQAARRFVTPCTPDLLQITNEPHNSSGTAPQRINFNFTPGTNITRVSITAQKTTTLTHGVVTGASDPLPDTSVLAIVSVTQGATTYVQGTDYQLTANNVDWSLPGAEPAPGSTYTVTYTYITLVTPTAVDDFGFTVSGALASTAILVDYQQKLPRIDRLCLDSNGFPVFITGVAAEYYPQIPPVPESLLPLATISQTWLSTTRKVTNDGVRLVPMPAIAGIFSRLDYILQLVAQQRLASDVNTREAGVKLGLFTDPFIDDSQRDIGTTQTAAVVSGELVLPITPTVLSPSADVLTPTPMNFTESTILAQLLRTDPQQINPYMAFNPVPAKMVLNPAVDRWTDIITQYAQPIDRVSYFTRRFWYGLYWQRVVTTNTVLANVSTSPVEALRQINVLYTLTGFQPLEPLTALTFDGVSVMPGIPPVADGTGKVTGNFTVPAGIPPGNKQVVATGSSGSTAQAIFSGQGTQERLTYQNVINVSSIFWNSYFWPYYYYPYYFDPVAQTFTLQNNAQISGVDLWFTAQPTTKTQVQIRTTVQGIPTATVLANAELIPASINVGGASTRFEFPFPANLIGGQEYAIVVLCDDAVGSVYTAQLGHFDNYLQRWVTTQPYTVGVLLTSSNASTWTPSQDRDLTFRLIKANFSAPTQTIPLGHVTVTAATDLMMMAYSDRPSSATAVKYLLTFPDSSTAVLEDGQTLQLTAAISGDIQVAALLSGNTDASPVLYPGTQLVAGAIGTSGTYYANAIPGSASTTVKFIFEALVPSGSSVVASYKGPSGGPVTVPVTNTRSVDNGFVEFTCSLSGQNALTVQPILTLTGSAAARIRVRNLRVYAL